MSLISITVPNLISGVSQQADALRFASQAEDSVNAYPSLVEGLIKRPASQHIAKLINNSAGDVSVHTINRDATEQYTAVFTTDAGAPVKVFDMNGVAKTVYLASGASSYLPTSPSASLKCLTVADYTLVLNKNKTVELDAAVGTAGYPEALVFVKQGGYNLDYAIEISYLVSGVKKTNKFKVHTGNGVKTGTSAIDATYTRNMQVGTVQGEVTTAYTDTTWPREDHANTLVIAKKLAELVSTPDTSMAVEVIGSTIYIKRTSNQAFTISVSDSLSGGGLKLTSDSVQSFSDLPIYAEHGYIAKITGEPESEGDEYWVRFEATNGTSGEGVWIETVGFGDDKAGLQYKYTASTLPHALVRLSSGAFLFTPLNGATATYGAISYTAPLWGERKAGDDDTNPEASFTGRKLSDMLFYKNRLAFLSDENIIFSEASEFFNFWRTTVTQLLDADPIDVATSSTKVSILFAGIPFFDRLLLFSNQTQFTLQSADNLTPKTVSIQNTTSFECSPSSVPVSVGKNVYFAFTKNNYSGIQEYFISPDTTLLDGTDISASIPSFISGTVSKLAGSDNEQVLAILSSGLPNGFYLYKYLFNGNEKLQSAWCRMELDPSCTIKNIDFINNTLYLTIQRGTEGLFLEKIELQAYKNDANSPYSVLLDRKISDATAGVSRAYNSGTGKTTITLPYLISSANASVVTRAVGSYIGGTIVDVDSASTNTVVVSGNYTSIPIWIGERYSMTHTMGRVVLRASTQKGGTAVVSSGKLYLKRASLQYNNSRSFTIRVLHENESNPDTYEYVFNSQIVGTPTATIGQNNILDGVFKFPILSKNDRVIIQLTNDTPHPCALLSMDIEAQYVTRSQRLG